MKYVILIPDIPSDIHMYDLNLSQSTPKFLTPILFFIGISRSWNRWIDTRVPFGGMHLTKIRVFTASLEAYSVASVGWTREISIFGTGFLNGGLVCYVDVGRNLLLLLESSIMRVLTWWWKPIIFFSSIFHQQGRFHPVMRVKSQNFHYILLKWCFYRLLLFASSNAFIIYRLFISTDVCIPDNSILKQTFTLTSKPQNQTFANAPCPVKCFANKTTMLPARTTAPLNVEIWS